MKASDTPYTLRRSSRAKYIRLRVSPGGVVTLTVPETTSLEVAEKFLRSRAEWLARAIQRMRQFIALPKKKSDYVEHKERARALIVARVEHWNAKLSYEYRRIAIKNTRTTWGSCSAKLNLNFSYKLVFLPSELVDYVVVHELCHLKEHNHGPRFWADVERLLPDYVVLRRDLKRYVPNA